MPIRSHRPRCAFLLAVLALGLSAGGASAQSYPNRQVTFVVPNPPGGVVDGSARLLADPLARLLGQAVVVDNRGGASGNVAYAAVARAPKDGHTLLISYSAYHVGNPSMFESMPWRQDELAPVALIAAATNLITVHPSVPSATLVEFIDWLKARPGQANYASQGNGSLAHVGTALFESRTGTQMTHVPYRGSGPALQDLLAGNVQVFITTPPSVLGAVQAGRLKAYAVTSASRHPMLPDLPTTAEAGLPGFELEAWTALFAPAGTPDAVIAKLTADVERALAEPESQARARTLGIELRYRGPAALAKLVETETAYWGEIIRTRSIRAE